MENIIEEDKKFLKSQSLADYDPVIEYVDYPITITDKIRMREVESINTRSVWNNYFTYTCYDNNLKQFVAHTYAIKSRNAGKNFDIQEVRRDFETYPSIYRNLYYIDYGMNSGCHVVWKEVVSAGWYNCEIRKDSNWTIIPEYYLKKYASHSLELNCIENIIASDLSLRYFGWVENNSINMIDYIKLYRKEPIVETFMKLRLFRFFENLKSITFANENKTFRKWLYANYEECQGMAFQTVRNAFKKNPNGSVSDYYNSLMYRIECGKILAIHDKEIYEYALKFASQEKIREYLEENNINTSSYFDYLKACQWLQLDFNDTKIMFPKDFQVYHDEYTRQYSEWKTERDKEIAEKNAKAISKRMLETANKYCMYTYRDDDYLVLLATSKVELINEGSKLKHCVGRMNYDERQARGESMICFVRHANDPTNPYVTVELGLNDFKVRQCYGHHDSKPNEETLNFVHNIWLPACNKARKKANI